MVGEKFVELSATFVEGDDTSDSIESRNETENQRWGRNKEIVNPCVQEVGPTTHILVDVEAMTLVYVV